MPRPVPLAVLPVPLAAPTPTSLPASPAPLPTFSAAPAGWRVTRSPAPLPTPSAAFPVPLAVPLPTSPAPLPTSPPGLRGWVWDGAGVVWVFWAGTLWLEMAKANVRSAMDGVENAGRMDEPSYRLDASESGLGAVRASLECPHLRIEIWGTRLEFNYGPPRRG